MLAFTCLANNFKRVRMHTSIYLAHSAIWATAAGVCTLRPGGGLDCLEGGLNFRNCIFSLQLETTYERHALLHDNVLVRRLACKSVHRRFTPLKRSAFCRLCMTNRSSAQKHASKISEGTWREYLLTGQCQLELSTLKLARIPGQFCANLLSCVHINFPLTSILPFRSSLYWLRVWSRQSMVRRTREGVPLRAGAMALPHTSTSSPLKQTTHCL